MGGGPYTCRGYAGVAAAGIFSLKSLRPGHFSSDLMRSRTFSRCSEASEAWVHSFLSSSMCSRRASARSFVSVTIVSRALRALLAASSRAADLYISNTGMSLSSCEPYLAISSGPVLRRSRRVRRI